MPAESLPVNVNTVPDQQVNRRSTCGRLLFLFANRRLLRRTVIVLLLIVFITELSMMQPVDGDARLEQVRQSSAVVAMVVISAIAVTVSLMWAMLHFVTCCRYNNNY